MKTNEKRKPKIFSALEININSRDALIVMLDKIVVTVMSRSLEWGCEFKGEIEILLGK